MSKKDSNLTPLRLAKELARIIEDKKGEDIIIFDLRDISPITDFFVIATGLSDIHNRTIAEYLSDFAAPDHIEGLEGGGWILLDYIDVIVHLFSKEAREFYGLERLWGDAPRIKL
ncbi:MAG: ribosome silencing factor [candidate division WOR-3 bacterium]